MGECITTYTGVRFDPLAPDKDGIRIEDIAHALSLICRGNGHVQTFYSVGQHCIQCAREAEGRGYSQRVILACLLHDASECYMSDVPRPLKSSMKAYCDTEDALLRAIYEKYLGSDLTEDEQRLVKGIDDDVLYWDLKILLRDPPDREEPEMILKPDHTVRGFREVEEEYLSLYRKNRIVG